MNFRAIWAMPLAGLVTVSLFWCESFRAADPPQPAEPGTLIVLTSTGKEQKLKTWRIVGGTTHLSWLAPATPSKEKKDDEDKDDKKDKNGKPGVKTKKPSRPRPPSGPEALVFREEDSTTFIEGITTLVPLDRIRSISFDNEKQTATVRVAVGDKEDATVELTGSTKYRGINKIVIEAETDLGDLGVAEVKYQGGVPKGGIRGVTFPAPKPSAAAAAGRSATIHINDKDHKTHKVTDLQPLYRFADGSQRVLLPLLFKKTIKIDVAKIQKIHLTKDEEAEKDKSSTSWQVTLKDGAEHTLSLLVRNVPVTDAEATLEGLLGRVPAGYKLYPIHLISAIEFDETKVEPKE